MDERRLPLRLVDRYLSTHTPASWAPFVSHEDVARQRDRRDFAYQLLVPRLNQIPMEMNGDNVRWLFDDLERIFITAPYIAIESTADAAAVYFFFSKLRHPSLNPTSDYIKRTYRVLILSHLEDIDSSDLEHMVFPPEPLPFSEIQIIDVVLSDAISRPGRNDPSTLTDEDFRRHNGYPCDSRSLHIRHIGELNLYEWRHILGRFPRTSIHDSCIYHSKALVDQFTWVDNIRSISLSECAVGQEVFQALFNRCVNLEELLLDMVSVSQSLEEDAPILEVLYPNESKLLVFSAVYMNEIDMQIVLECLANTSVSNLTPFKVDSLRIELLGENPQIGIQNVVCKYVANNERMRTLTVGIKELKILLVADKTGIESLCLMNLMVEIWSTRDDDAPFSVQLMHVVEFLDDDGWMPFLPHLKVVRIGIRGEDPLASVDSLSRLSWESLDLLLGERRNPIWMGVDLCGGECVDPDSLAEEIRCCIGERAHVRIGDGEYS